jgi:hypothetical protein
MICTADALNARRISAGRGLARQYDEQTDAGRPRGIACQFLHLYQPAKWLTHGQVSTRHADESDITLLGIMSYRVAAGA